MRTWQSCFLRLQLIMRPRCLADGIYPFGQMSAWTLRVLPHFIFSFLSFFVNIDSIWQKWTSHQVEYPGKLKESTSLCSNHHVHFLWVCACVFVSVCIGQVQFLLEEQEVVVLDQCLKGSKLSQALCLRSLPEDMAIDVSPSNVLFRDKSEKEAR